MSATRTRINTAGLPWASARIIAHTLSHEDCTADHVLLMADALEKFQAEHEPGARYDAFARTIAQLRDVAPEYAR